MADTIDFGNLAIEITRQGSEVVTYTFRGDVDEHFRQAEVPRIKADRIIFVLEDINNFNSCGIREWIYLIRDMGELGELTFTRCSVTMIDQINMYPTLSAKRPLSPFLLRTSARKAAKSTG